MSNKNNKIYCERVEPWKFTNIDALECGECVVNALEKTPINLYAQGERYRYKNVESLQDPRDRLQTIIDNSKLYNFHINSWGRMIWGSVLDSTTAVYIARSKNDNGRIVGCCVWKYPTHMQEQLNNELNRNGFKWTIYYYYKKIVLWVQEKLARKWYEHPFVNTRLSTYSSKNRSVHEKGQMTIEQIAERSGEDDIESCYYPKHLMLYCSIFCTHPNYQKKGIGKHLLQQCFDTIPNVPTPITEDIKGPQKLYLEATPLGALLYKKAGFEEIVKNVEEISPYKIESILMMMSR